MDVSRWQKKLEDYFTVEGVIGGHLLEVIKLEVEHEKCFIRSFHGQDVLMNSFQSFFIETIKSAYDLVQKNGWPKDSDSYSVVLLYYVIMFRSFRACEILLLKGYPLDGYALLRDLKDRVIFMAAVAHNITTFNAACGYSSKLPKITPEEWKKNKGARIKEENRLLNWMIRKESGMPSDILDELENWEQLFNEEVHGSRFSFFSELHMWLAEKRPPTTGPIPNMFSMPMYMNRACEIAWLILRLLPYLQPSENAFGEEWLKKHEILDESFLHMQKGLGEKGKKIGDVFIFFVNQKYSFKRPFYYFEADGSGEKSL